MPVTTKLDDYHPAADGKTDDASLFQQAINACPTPGAVLVSAGTYLIATRLTLKSGVVLRGEGAQVTHLVINIHDGKQTGAIAIGGRLLDPTLAVQGRVDAGATRLTLASSLMGTAGGVAWISQENDETRMYTRSNWNQPWAQRAQGQLVRLIRVIDRVWDFDTPLRLTYEARRHPHVRWLDPIEQAGIENLHLKRLDRSEDAIISFHEAVNCWVRDCEMEYATRWHVEAVRSRHLTIEGNAIHHAWNYGGGGHGYGVYLSAATSDCLVTHNAFWSLRHAMIIGRGANGNVFSYNHSTDAKLCDISIHGHFTYMNLFEGNDVQFIQVADYWGPAGPFTTLFRNRVRKRDLRVNDHSHRTNVVGNTVVHGGIVVDRTAEDVLVRGNRIRGVLDPSNPDLRMSPSLYLTAPPAFWGNRPWPGIGADVDQERPAAWRPLPASLRVESSSRSGKK